MMVSSWSCPELDWPFTAQHADHTEYPVVHPDVPADRLVRSEELVAHYLTYQADIGAARHVRVRERGPFRDFPAPDLQIIGGDAAEVCRPVAVTRDNAYGPVHVRRYAFDERHIISDCFHVSHGKGSHPVAAGPHTVHVPGTRLDPYEVVPQVLELKFGLLRTGRAEGNHADHRGDADGNPDCR